MLMKVYAVYDVKAEVFGNPVVGVNDYTMMRLMSDVLQNVEHPYAKHPEDYVLYRLGEYDDSSGVVSGDVAPVSLIVLSEISKG